MKNTSGKFTDKQLWIAYTESRSDWDRNQIFEFHHQHIKDSVAGYLRLSNRSWLYDDVLSFVTERIISATIPGFDVSRCTSFMSYLDRHILGAILDAIRTLDAPSRRNQEIASMIQNAREFLSHEVGHNPTDFEVAEYLNISEITVIEVETACCDTPEYQDRKIADKRPMRRDMVHNLENRLNGLKTSSKEILHLHYIAGMSLREIGSQLGLSESRIAKRLTEIRRFLKKNDH